ncbi:MAG: sigma-54-dependent Fis family transcriptional regulator [Planctomycetes bacterium]|nr:sigma-54-dependent Fis family transcriptional regulator [Planctomycetota bacterium]
MGRTALADTIVGAESGLRAVMDRVAVVAPSDVPVLIFGETGTGKELVARAIHNRSPRSAGPIIRVNCGAIPPELIDSELFGHERGAFTGAVETRRGWFERADGGTLFLDELGEMPAAAQVRLLRVLQDGWLERVGGKHPIHVDVRVVAATHQQLAEMVAQGTFRDDLWYRISVFPIVLPPLRERTADVAELAQHFAQRAAIRFGLAAVSPSPEDIRLLCAYSWPGNVRELAAVIDRAAILGNGNCLAVAQALGGASHHPIAQRAHRAGAVKKESTSAIAPLNTVIRDHIESALRATRGRIEGPLGAAAALQVNPHTLRARMRKLGINWQQFR